MQLEGQEMWEPVRILCCPVLFPFGQGYGIGLFLRGAKAMAEVSSSFRQILHHYFPNTTRTLFGEPDAICALNERLLPSDSLNMTLLAGSQRSFLRIALPVRLSPRQSQFQNCCVASRPPG